MDDEKFSGIKEGAKLLEEYKLKDNADFEYKKTVPLPPLDIKRRNEIWCNPFYALRLKLRQQLEGRSTVHCEKLKTAAILNISLIRIKMYALSVKIRRLPEYCVACG